jgi:hypothetical protein
MEDQHVDVLERRRETRAERLAMRVGDAMDRPGVSSLLSGPFG